MDEMENGSSGPGDWQYVEGKPRGTNEPVRILPGDAQPTRPVGRGSQPHVPYEGPSQQQPAPGSGRLQPYEPAMGSDRVRAAQSQNQAPVVQPHQAASPQAPTVVQVKRGPTVGAILAGTFAVLTLSCALLAFATFQGGLDSLGKLGGVFPNFSLVTTPTVTINTQPAVINQIRGLSRLETVNYQLEKVVTGKSSGPLPDLLTSDKILLVAHGEVVAGIDLGDLKPEDVTVLSGTVTIKLPEAKVLFTRLDNEKTYVYDRQTGIFSKPDANLETEMRRVAEQEILAAALEDGILQKASDNAETVLRTLVTGLGYKEVRFEQSP